MPTRPLKIAEKLPVKDRSGETLYYVNSRKALKLIEHGYCIAKGTKTCIRSLQVAPGTDSSKVIPLSAYVGQRYSHKHENRENPEGCWTLKRIPNSAAPIFDAVLSSCINRVAA